MNHIQSKQDEKWYVSIWTHPLALLLIGSTISYLLVPLIGERVSHQHVLQEQRVDMARDIQKQSLIVDEQLNAMVTAYEMFDKGAIIDPTTYKTAQAELRRSSRELYLQFDQHAWYWSHDLPLQSRLLELPPGSESKIIDLNKAYMKNLESSTGQIGLLGEKFGSKNYAPNKNSAVILAAARKRMNELAYERGAITSQLSGIFMPAKLNW